MRIIVYGLGAVGGIVAARLQQGGANVVGVARGAHLAAVRANGLDVRSVEGVDNVRLSVVAGLGELTPRDDDVDTGDGVPRSAPRDAPRSPDVLTRQRERGRNV